MFIIVYTRKGLNLEYINLLKTKQILLLQRFKLIFIFETN